MDEPEANKTLGITLRGEFSFYGNPQSEFKGPIKRGLRIVLWGNSDKLATSCSFVKEDVIHIGSRVETDIVILSPQSIDKKIKIGESYFIGMPGVPIGEFKITKILGKWEGKVP